MGDMSHLYTKSSLKNTRVRPTELSWEASHKQGKQNEHKSIPRCQGRPPSFFCFSPREVCRNEKAVQQRNIFTGKLTKIGAEFFLSFFPAPMFERRERDKKEGGKNYRNSRRNSGRALPSVCVSLVSSTYDEHRPVHHVPMAHHTRKNSRSRGGLVSAPPPPTPQYFRSISSRSHGRKYKMELFVVCTCGILGARTRVVTMVVTNF